jgi:hypothetical protein
VLERGGGEEHRGRVLRVECRDIKDTGGD